MREQPEFEQASYRVYDEWETIRHDRPVMSWQQGNGETESVLVAVDYLGEGP